MEKKISNGLKERKYAAFSPITGSVYLVRDILEDAIKDMTSSYTMIVVLQVVKLLEANPVMTEVEF